jgi:hypothetical protein
MSCKRSSETVEFQVARFDWRFRGNHKWPLKDENWIISDWLVVAGMPNKLVLFERDHFFWQHKSAKVTLSLEIELGAKLL